MHHPVFSRRRRGAEKKPSDFLPSRLGVLACREPMIIRGCFPGRKDTAAGILPRSLDRAVRPKGRVQHDRNAQITPPMSSLKDLFRCAGQFAICIAPLFAFLWHLCSLHGLCVTSCRSKTCKVTTHDIMVHGILLRTLAGAAWPKRCSQHNVLPLIPCRIILQNTATVALPDFSACYMLNLWVNFAEIFSSLILQIVK